MEGCIEHSGLLLVAAVRGQDALGTAGGTLALPKSAIPAFPLVFALSSQGRLLAAGFLRGNEIGVGILPEQEQLLITSRGRRTVGLGLCASRSQQTERVVGSLPQTCSSLAKGQSFIPYSRLEVGYGLLRIFHLERCSAEKMR